MLARPCLAALALAASICGPGHAQPVEPIAASVLRPWSTRAAATAPTQQRLAVQLDSDAMQSRDLSWLGGAVQYEAPRESVNGTYTRPKIAVGVPSESLKEWMNSAGVPAEQCLLPMVRARARVGPDGDPNGTLWVAARCSFQ